MVVCGPLIILLAFHIGIGPRIPRLAGNGSRTLLSVHWFGLDTATQRLVRAYELWMVTHPYNWKETVIRCRLSSSARSSMFFGLSAWTTYNVSIRGLYYDGVVGISSSILVSTQQDRKSRQQ